MTEPRLIEDPSLIFKKLIWTRFLTCLEIMTLKKENRILAMSKLGIFW